MCVPQTLPSTPSSCLPGDPWSQHGTLASSTSSGCGWTSIVSVWCDRNKSSLRIRGVDDDVSLLSKIAGFLREVHWLFRGRWMVLCGGQKNLRSFFRRTEQTCWTRLATTTVFAAFRSDRKVSIQLGLIRFDLDGWKY
ncbi:hypothetical protein ACLB2K_050967 [Fragaria x ananassa]